FRNPFLSDGLLPPFSPAAQISGLRVLRPRGGRSQIAPFSVAIFLRTNTAQGRSTIIKYLDLMAFSHFWRWHGLCDLDGEQTEVNSL
ncbi:MAG: hypothetical protein ACXVCS_22685, partial [Bdellovibrionota bacterium]